MSNEVELDKLATDIRDHRVAVMSDVADDVGFAVSTSLTKAVIDIDSPKEIYTKPCSGNADFMKLNAMRCYIGNDIKRLKQDSGWLVENLFLTSQEYTSKSGEVISGPVLHLISPEGKSIRIVAKYSILAILTFAKSWHKFPWIPPVRMRAVDAILDSGNRVYNIEFSE